MGEGRVPKMIILADEGLPEHVDCANDQVTAWWIAQSTWSAPAAHPGSGARLGVRGGGQGVGAAGEKDLQAGFVEDPDA
jgi:hypothetical protein